MICVCCDIRLTLHKSPGQREWKDYSNDNNNVYFIALN